MQKTEAIFLTLIFLFFALNLSGQLNIPKKSNTIRIEKTGNADSLLMWYAKSLSQNGYFVDVNKEFKNLKTDFKIFPWSGTGKLQITARTKQEGDKAVLFVTGSIEIVNLLASQPVPFESCHCGWNGDARRVSFEKMLRTMAGSDYEKLDFLRL